MRLVWLTDVHLNFLTPEGVAAFFDRVAAARPDAVLISGDTAVSQTLGRFLEQLAERVARPIHFVLGNHDFWGSSVEAMSADMTALSQRSRLVRWLGAEAEPVALTEAVGLVGHDGWYDGRIGDYEGSGIFINDWVRMDDFAYQQKAGILEVMQRLAERATRFLEPRVAAALERFEHVFVVTHVPPFREAAWHEGQISNDEWLPFMTSQRMGDMLRAAMQARPDRRMTVLCGHTHGRGEAQVLPNLLVKTGGAVYREPELQPVIEL